MFAAVVLKRAILYYSEILPATTFEVVVLVATGKTVVTLDVTSLSVLTASFVVEVVTCSVVVVVSGIVQSASKHVYLL